jgi:hypothetical protein
MFFNNASITSEFNLNTSSKSDVHAYVSYYWSNIIIDIIGYLYLMPLVSIIGFLLNSLAFFILASMKSNDSLLYKLMMTRTLSDMGLLLIGALTPLNTCQTCSVRGTWISLAFGLYLGDLGSNFFHTLSSFADILIVHCRLCTLIDTCCLCRCLSKPSYKTQMLCMLFISWSFHAPKLFTRAIVSLPMGNSSTLTIGFYDYVNRNAFNYYYLFVGVVQNLFTLFVLIVLNVLLLRRFRHCLEQNTIISSSGGTLIRTSEKMLTKMVLGSSLLFGISHTAQCCTAIAYRLISFGLVKYNFIVSVWVYCSYMITYGALSGTFIVYVVYNKGFANRLVLLLENALILVGVQVTFSSEIN